MHPSALRCVLSVPFQWIYYYYGSNKFTGKENGKTHLCAEKHNPLVDLYLISKNSILKNQV